MTITFEVGNVIVWNFGRKVGYTVLEIKNEQVCLYNHETNCETHVQCTTLQDALDGGAAIIVD